MNVGRHLASSLLLVAAGLAACTPVERTYPPGIDGTGGMGGAKSTTSTSSVGGAPATTSSSSSGGGGDPATGSVSASASTGVSCSVNADCPSGPNSAPTCLPGGVCGLVCDGGFDDCDSVASTGCEAKLAADKDNCGSCGKACFYSCSQGTCSDPTSVAVGADFTCALLGTGQVACWGNDQQGQIGNGAMGGVVATPLLVALPAPAAEITAGGSFTGNNNAHACARLVTGEVFCWGSNQQGQLGNGNTAPTPVPMLVQSLPSALHVSAGSSHTCAVAVGGMLFCWGNNSSGQLGTGQFGTFQPNPMVVNLSQPVNVVSAGGTFTCALDAGGAASCWGLNQTGKLGTGDTVNHPMPTPVVQVNQLLGISTGANHACGWTASDVFCWGDNTLLAVGIPGAPPTSPFPKGLGIGPAQSVAAGADFGGALPGTTGDLWMWGTGPLADGTTQSPAPKKVLAGVASFDVGGRTGVQVKHACAIKTTGELVCWGDDSFGQLGDGLPGGIKATPITVKLP
jgi:alpha-tubulin suppressor-like RCC1 family protein